MADLTQHNYTGKYSGLLNNFWVTLTIAGVCLVGYELEVHIPRRRGKDGTFQRIPVRLYRAAWRGWQQWRSGGREGERVSQEPDGEAVDEKGAQDKLSEARTKLGSREKWEFGYIHQPKAWRLNPAPPVPRWPLAWIWTALSVSEKDMPDTCGLDITLHMRFLRGAFFYTLLQACVVLPILMPLHIFYSSNEISKTSMIRASVSSLVESSGSRWLWIHVLLIWWATITWTMTLLWITWGGLGYRRRQIRKLAEQVKSSRERRRRMALGEDGLTDADHWTVGDEGGGIKKFRTLMVTNVPPDMRDERTLRDYFDHYLHRHRVRSGHIAPKRAVPSISIEKEDTVLHRVALSPKRLLKQPTRPKMDRSVPVTPPNEAPNQLSLSDECNPEGDHFESEVEDVILVRKLGSVASLRERRTKVLRQLEVAHVKLARRVLGVVAKHKAKFASNAENDSSLVLDTEKGLDGLNTARNRKLPPDITKSQRLEMLIQALGRFVGDEDDQLGLDENDVWTVLHSLPRELIDPYQSLTHLTSLFREENAPLIDYLTTKLSYLTLLLDEARSRPLSSYAASSTAFVTFRDARTARLALKILDSHPKRSLACHTTPAPDWTELLWARMSKSVYRSEFVRRWVVYLGVWAFTLVWIFPVSLLCALSSLQNIAGFIKPLEGFIAKHPTAAGLITSLVPVLLVAGLTIAICPILLVIANKAETINTRLGIHNSVLERFWKFRKTDPTKPITLMLVMVNGVVFFAIGQSAIQAYLTAFQNSNFDPLPTVATAFPTAAPYFASYVLLQTAIQPFFELFRFGLPAIVYVFGTRVSTIPRQRDSRTEHPTFSHFSQVPLQLLVNAIMHLFMLLNPLVIPFCLVFYGSCYIVWKKQFTYVYGRLYENNGRRTSIRVLRYSLDALALAQFVLFAFFVLNKAKGHAIATGILFFLTLTEKIIITRALKQRFDNLDIEESELMCPPVADSEERDANDAADAFDAEDDPAYEHAGKTKSKGRFALLRHGVAAWVGYRAYDGKRRPHPAGYRKPIPFDHLLFSTLDRKFRFDGGVGSDEAVVSELYDEELRHEPDHVIHHEVASKLVTPHHPLRPWEDIPPYHRMRGYDDQPAYTDDYDDFLWLPRDPLSTLDLDDTVEVRLSLTTSAGGSGQISEWPFASESDSIGGAEDGETWREIHPADLDRVISPDARSDECLIDAPLSSNIGSEVADGYASTGLMRRRTRKIGQGLTALFKRPRAGTNTTVRSDGEIPMQSLAMPSSGSAGAPVLHIKPHAKRSASPSIRFSPGARPSIMLITARPEQNLPTTPTLPTLSIPPSPASLAADPITLSATKRSTLELSSVLQEPSGRVDLDDSPRRPSHLTILDQPHPDRRPSLGRGSSVSTGQRSPGREQSARIPSRAKSTSRGRDRSSSIWSNHQIHQKWLREVMDEEKVASEDARREELQEEAKDQEELEKEERRRAGTQTPELNRSGSRLGDLGRSRSTSRGRSASGSMNGSEMRPRVERGNNGASAGSRSTLGLTHPPKTAPL